MISAIKSGMFATVLCGSVVAVSCDRKPQVAKTADGFAIALVYDGKVGTIMDERRATAGDIIPPPGVGRQGWVVDSLVVDPRAIVGTYCDQDSGVRKGYFLIHRTTRKVYWDGWESGIHKDVQVLFDELLPKCTPLDQAISDLSIVTLD